MKRANSLLFIILFSIQFVIAQKTPKKVNYDDIELRTYKGNDTVFTAYLKGSNKPFSGIACNYDPSTNIEVDETTYINGKPIGDWKTFYDDGKLHEEGANNENGQKDGKYYEYYETGLINCEGEYKDGLKTNAWDFYYDNGDFNIGGQYVLDKKWGIWIYRDHNGKEIKEITYDMDVITDIKTRGFHDSIPLKWEQQH